MMSESEYSLDLFSDNENNGEIISHVYERIRAFSIASGQITFDNGNFDDNQVINKYGSRKDSSGDDDDVDTSNSSSSSGQNDNNKNNVYEDDPLDMSGFIEKFKSFSDDYLRNGCDCSVNNISTPPPNNIVTPIIRRVNSHQGCNANDANNENGNMDLLNSLSFSSSSMVDSANKERRNSCKDVTKLIDNNKKWVESINVEKPGYFNETAKQSTPYPEYLWIGCSDSRVSANVITGTKPGELFVHRNIANMVLHADMNVLSALSYAVEVLKVKHVIVCGHYDCGGIRAAMSKKRYGLIDYWLKQVKEVYKKHHVELENIEKEEMRLRALVELNVKEQVYNVCNTAIVQNVWNEKERSLHVHGWVYDTCDGMLHDLKTTFSNNDQLHAVPKLSP